MGASRTTRRGRVAGAAAGGRSPARRRPPLRSLTAGRRAPAAAPSPSPVAARGGARAACCRRRATDAADRPRAGVQAAVAAALRDPALGGRLAVSVVDAATGDAVYERAADVPLLPASTAKIATAVAALTACRADLRLTTRVVAGAAPGDVVLVGGGDPTLAGPRRRRATRGPPG